MKNIVGTPARGEHFFPRKSEVDKILVSIDSGNNLQLAAPRRVGKTSILYHLMDNGISNYQYVYVDTESIDNHQEFFKKLLKTILRNEHVVENKKLKRLLDKGGSLLKKVKSVKIMGNGIDMVEPEAPDYYEDLNNFLGEYESENGSMLVLLIDEFPQTILNITEKEDALAAKKFLQANRELRLHPEIQPKVRFIYTGSIGLNHTVANIQCSAFVNDLNTIEVSPLTAEEATTFVQKLLSGANSTQPAVEYLVGKLKWLIPFHIQLVVQEILTIQRQNNATITEATADAAFENIIGIKNNNHFKHYYDRLGVQLKGTAYDYAEKFLEGLANGNSINKTIAADMAIPFNLEKSYRNILEMLSYDGYISLDPISGNYHFNSPLLEMWWKKFICK